MEFTSKVFYQVFQTYKALPPKKRVFFVVAILITISSLAGLIVWAKRIEYKSLYAGLSSEDTGAVIGKLSEMKVPYKVGVDGNTIMVPAASIYKLRMELAREGLPQSTGIGYEIFDKQNMGVTEFVQKVNFQRALQGELSRTITCFNEIKNARVHLTIPDKTLFLNEQEKPRASVLLTLYPGKTLMDSQIRGVVRLVASSVEGLSADDVIIVDSHGKLLAGGEEKSKLIGINLSQEELQSSTERKLERKIESMLADIVGQNSITAKVTVAMDFTHIEQTEENYDPDKVAVRSEQRSTEKSSGENPFAVRAPGGMSNTPDLKETEKGALPSKSVNYDKNDETINYEISHVVKKTINPVGTIERITAAVLIDGTYKIAKDKDGKEVRNYVPRSGDEMAKYSALVKKALGYDKDRGDSVEVVNVQFNETGFEPETVTDRFIRQIDWQSMITYLITAILFALFFIYGLKPLLKILSKTVEKVEVAGRFTDRGQETGRLETDEFPHGIPTPGAVKPGEKEGQLLNFAKTNPKLFAQYLKSWIR